MSLRVDETYRPDGTKVVTVWNFGDTPQDYLGRSLGAGKVAQGEVDAEGNITVLGQRDITQEEDTAEKAVGYADLLMEDEEQTVAILNLTEWVMSQDPNFAPSRPSRYTVAIERAAVLGLVAAEIVRLVT